MALCARGDTKVSCEPRTGMGGGVSKTAGRKIRKGLRRASGLGSGQGLWWRNYSEGFQPSLTVGWCAGGAPTMVAIAFHSVCYAAAFPYESALRGTSSNVQWGKELVVVDVGRPINNAA